MPPENKARRRAQRHLLWLTGVALGCALVALVVSTALFAEQVHLNNGRADRQLQIGRHLRQLHEIHQALTDAETGQRGYLLTGKPRYLQTYRAAVDRLPARLAALDGLALPPSGMAPHHVHRLQDLARRKLAELAQTVALFGRGQRQQALALVQTDAGQTAMEEARQVLDGMATSLTAERDELNRQVVASNSASRTLAVSTAAALVLCMVLTGLQIAHLSRARTRYQAALAASEEHHRAIVEEQEELISLSDAQGRLLYVNPAYARQFGRVPAEMVGGDLHQDVHPADRAMVAGMLRRVLETGATEHGENRMSLPDGRECWMAWTNRLKLEPDGTRLLHSVGRDITLRRQAHEALQASREFLARTGELAGVGGWEYDLVTQQVHWSDEVRRLHEADEDFQPTPQSVLDLYGPEARAVLEEAAERARRTGQSWDLELPLTTHKGRQLCIRSVGTVKFDADGRPVKLIGASQDVTQRKQTERKLRDLTEIFDATPDFVVQADRKGQVTYLNHAARRALGLAHEQDVGTRHFSEFNTPHTNRLYAEVITPTANRDGAWLGETTVYDGERRVVPVNHLVIAHKEADGRIVRYSAVMRDISAEVRAREDLRLQTATLGAVIEAIPAMVMVLDAQMKFRLVNHAYEAWRGRPRSALIGQGLDDLGQAEAERLRPWARRALSGETVSFEHEDPHASQHRHLSISYIPLRLEDGSIAGIIGVGHDITVHREEARRLTDLTQRDPLTTLLNRAGFEHVLRDTIDRGLGDQLALLYIDLDHFKPINDQHGHAAGDEVLRQFSQRLQRVVRPTDAVARLGGDEFAVALCGVRQAADAQRVAEKILDIAQAPFSHDGMALCVGASVGVAFQAGNEGWESLVARADRGMYRSKRSGRGRIMAEAC